MNIFLTLFYGNDDVNNGNEKYDDHDDGVDAISIISISISISILLLLLFIIMKD